jgi:ParB/RepB/Spo0J family partition protein
MLKISERVEFLSPNSLKPDSSQPRKTFEQEAVDSLAQTILSQGIIAPIEVDENNTIVTGEIRWKASKKAKVPTIPIRRIYGIKPEERLERQLIENLHRKDIPFNERDGAIYKLFMSGRYGEPHNGQGKAGEGALTNLAKTIGLSSDTISRIIDAEELRRRTTSRVTREVPTTVIAETRGLPDETRVKLLEKVAKKEVLQPPGQSQIRKAVKVVKHAPEPIKDSFLKGELPLEKAIEITEAAEKAPEPLKKAIARREVEPEKAKQAVKLYEELKEKGVELEPTRVSLHVEEMKREARLDKAQERFRAETHKDIITGEKESVDTIFRERGRMFVNEVRDVAWKVKGWGLPHMKVVGAKNWKEAQKYFKQIYDHVEMLLKASPYEKE